MTVNRNKNLEQTVINIQNEFFLMMKNYFNNLNMIKKELSEEMKVFLFYILGLFKNCLFNKNDKGINNDDDLTNYYFSKLQKFKIDSHKQLERYITRSRHIFSKIRNFTLRHSFKEKNEL